MHSSFHGVVRTIILWAKRMRSLGERGRQSKSALMRANSERLEAVLQAARDENSPGRRAVSARSMHPPVRQHRLVKLSHHLCSSKSWCLAIFHTCPELKE
ncbi:unnamed protein product [Protopolystoma xenopodis]|uniref:Uncharacterized protein n=1 Tax=Protopolystoma xenopodis TaxID=117903 RepID=A0A3S5AUH0_9PLAT|nr:unnamed protein product [Protopolystoma xenopodis]